jgi:hypothetical protein
VHILGAGQRLGAGGADELPPGASWAVERLRSHRDALRILLSPRGGGWVIWEGQDYAWVPD